MNGRAKMTACTFILQSLQGSQGQVFALKTKIEELKIKLSLGEKLKTEVSTTCTSIQVQQKTAPVLFGHKTFQPLVIVIGLYCVNNG